jgi:dTDP-4-dehydrorhamnose 3,5-epimerase
MIEGVISSPLKIVPLHAGDVMTAMKKNDPGYMGFGEAYFSKINSGMIKAWKRHREMTCNFIVSKGNIRIVLVDDRNKEQYQYQEIIMSPVNYIRLTVPPMIWIGFQGMGTKTSILLNIANILHDPSESDNKEIHELTYDWSI